MVKSPTVRDILAKSAAYLAEKGVDGPRLSAEALLAHALGRDRLGLFLDMDRPLTPAELDICRPLVARRGRGEPLAYILGKREFYGLEFAVGPEALIPRPETEHLVDLVKARYPADAAFDFADLGAGSGILAVTLALAFPAARGLALDISEAALDLARQNAVRHGVATRLDWLVGDFAEIGAKGRCLDLVVSNPPYVSAAEYAGLCREVAEYEPRGALTPGPEGTEALAAVAAAAALALRPGGRLIVEIGCLQGQAVRAILAAAFADARVTKDYSGHDRVVEAVLASPA